MEGQEQLLFIDFEFTMPEGKSNPKGFYPEIIEVGIVSVKNQKIEEQFSSYVKPNQFPILSERCKTFLQISQEKIDQGMTFSELLSILSNYNQKAPTTVITWGNMDMKVLRHNCEMNKIEFPFTGKFRDLSMEYKKFFGDRNQTGLWKAVEEYGKKATGKHHRALDDALTTYNLFKLVEDDKRYLQKPTPPTIGDRIDLSEVLNKYAT
ncbi:3'-5' exonuclease KapD [Metabacillus halosaccharovorans]|uniref:3'-5' exonuclease KapD n=2 Tax=Metabacillus halosaccharovorans TaxID=930124 RepID=A0ABT3DIS0_9BACI|nr:3'-5' exonuclease KapD [Metabacillus halosaccharovorans]MCV9886907.1 3'-5' exonuclease KapD [Metabacillus halosaccharovorans]